MQLQKETSRKLEEKTFTVSTGLGKVLGETEASRELQPGSRRDRMHGVGLGGLHNFGALSARRGDFGLELAGPGATSAEGRGR